MSAKIPASWFDDDPEWQALRQRAEGQPVSKDLKSRMKYAKSVVNRQPPIKRKHESKSSADNSNRSSEEVVLNFKIALPKIKAPDIKAIYADNRRLFTRSGLMIASLLIIFGGLYGFQKWSNSRYEGRTLAGVTATQGVDFKPILPLEAVSGESDIEIRRDPEKQTLNYSSEFNGAVLTVSQQALPEDFKKNPDQLAYVAKQLRADNPIQTQKGFVYVATDEESKTQTAIFNTKDALVFIRANAKLDNEDWKFYINQLS